MLFSICCFLHVGPSPSFVVFRRSQRRFSTRIPPPAKRTTVNTNADVNSLIPEPVILYLCGTPSVQTLMWPHSGLARDSYQAKCWPPKLIGSLTFSTHFSREQLCMVPVTEPSTTLSSWFSSHSYSAWLQLPRCCWGYIQYRGRSDYCLCCTHSSLLMFSTLPTAAPAALPTTPLGDVGDDGSPGMWCVPEGREDCRRILNVTFGHRDGRGVCVPPSRYTTLGTLTMLLIRNSCCSSYAAGGEVLQPPDAT